MDLPSLSRRLSENLRSLDFAPPVAHVYDPTDYAREPHRSYLERYGGLGAKVLFLGMNPGPWGMAQTGVPFGAVSKARDWLGLEAPVGRPENEHPKRPVEGFACSREEVSGARLWGWAEERFGTPERFFERFFVANYCPLLFLEAGARNLTPDKLRAEDREPLLELCDQALGETVRILGVERVVGIGAFAEKRLRTALGTTEIEIGRILHPSPASPAANRGWAEAAERQLREMGIDI